MTETAATGRAQRVDAIRRRAIPVFAAQGFRATSMADLAAAAGVSRPALYQYFDNRADLFRAAFEALLDDTADAALAALASTGSAAERLDGFVQRASGDPYAAFSATPFGDELMEAKHEFAADVAADAAGRTRAGLRTYLETNTTVDAATRQMVIELVTLAPTGLKADRPTVPTYRRRLTALATAAAALLDPA